METRGRTATAGARATSERREMNGELHPGMRVLVVGSGAREHTIVWKLSHSPWRPVLYAAPGNPGMAALAERVDIGADDVAALVAFARDNHIELVVVGPEAPLAAGLVDCCTSEGIHAFGPTAAAAQLETSKEFSKTLMTRLGILTADFAVFSEAGAAKAYVLAQGAPIVVKADGLAAGKGVTVAMDLEAAFEAIDDALVRDRFGSSGQRVLIESYLQGPEASLMFFVDGNTVVPMLPARDYKRIGAGDTGPNTGGMGAIAPVLAEQPGIVGQVQTTIIEPILQALAKQGTPYRGVLYAGLMLTDRGPAVIEFNARFGDPETQAVLPLLASDLLEIFWAVTENQLSRQAVRWHSAHAVAVVTAAAGYPETPVTGTPMTIEAGAGDLVFHAGTALVAGQLTTSGGRVATAVGVATEVAEARRIAYHIAQQIYFEGKQIRRDIGT